jgi:hypothetical protein
MVIEQNVGVASSAHSEISAKNLGECDPGVQRTMRARDLKLTTTEAFNATSDLYLEHLAVVRAPKRVSVHLRGRSVAMALSGATPS